ncbi:MAG TPA: hypothetical protein VJP86_07005 [Vicinamibacterales bacterium]|jgi:hypothetical protein|nr:hypothetical protein [Vicinamibacterales bacterium]
MKRTLWVVAAGLALAFPFAAAAQRGDGNSQGDEHKHAPAPTTASVDFGVLPVGPIGPPPCLQSGAIGGPADPCSYKLHHLTPEETLVEKDGEVTFQVHGGGHAMAFYRVSKDTTRDDIGQWLCPGIDPETIADPNAHTCNLSTANANNSHIISDAKGDVVIVAQPGGANHPDNRVWSPDGRLMSVGGRQFLVGGSIPAGPTSDGQLVTYRFTKTGRYLVICMNRVHFLNDWMFGFVNVEGD